MKKRRFRLARLISPFLFFAIWELASHTLDSKNMPYYNQNDLNKLGKVVPVGECKSFRYMGELLQVGATITYYRLENSAFGLTSHPTWDKAYKEDIELKESFVYNTRIDKKETDSTDSIRGILKFDTKVGAFGFLNQFDMKDKQEIPIGWPKEGPAQMLTSCATNGKPQYYDIIITKVEKDSLANGFDNNECDAEFEICDSDAPLITGMSGSPIIQDGKLVLAATAVNITDNYGLTGYAQSVADMVRKEKQVLDGKTPRTWKETVDLLRMLLMLGSAGFGISMVGLNLYTETKNLVNNRTAKKNSIK